VEVTPDRAGLRLAGQRALLEWLVVVAVVLLADWRQGAAAERVAGLGALLQVRPGAG
jgi:hypothetical protein